MRSTRGNNRAAALSRDAAPVQVNLPVAGDGSAVDADESMPTSRECECALIGGRSRSYDGMRSIQVVAGGETAARNLPFVNVGTDRRDGDAR